MVLRWGWGICTFRKTEWRRKWALAVTGGSIVWFPLLELMLHWWIKRGYQLSAALQISNRSHFGFAKLSRYILQMAVIASVAGDSTWSVPMVHHAYGKHPVPNYSTYSTCFIAFDVLVIQVEVPGILCWSNWHTTHIDKLCSFLLTLPFYPSRLYLFIIISLGQLTLRMFFESWLVLQSG